MFHAPERFRVINGPFKTTASHGNNGVFLVRLPRGQVLRAAASDGMGWEHVIVSRHDRIPTWTEMCAIKDLFWDAEDLVVQYHPQKSQYVNCHPNCLHLWRPISFAMPQPPAILVGTEGYL